MGLFAIRIGEGDCSYVTCPGVERSGVEESTYYSH